MEDIFYKAKEIDGQDVLLLWEGNEVNGTFFINKRWDEILVKDGCRVESGRVMATFQYSDIKDISTDEQNIIVLKQ